MKTILVPVVGSPDGRRALDRAKQEAKVTGAEIVLVGAAEVGDGLAEQVEALESLMADLEKELLNEGYACRTEWYVGESLGEATLHVARETDADLIVMSLRRRTPLGKALLGSFEQEILLGSPCPVLSLPQALA